MAKLGMSFYPHGLTYRNAATFGKLAEDKGFDSVLVVEGGVNNDVPVVAPQVVQGEPAAEVRRLLETFM